MIEALTSRIFLEIWTTSEKRTQVVQLMYQSMHDLSHANHSLVEKLVQLIINAQQISSLFCVREMEEETQQLVNHLFHLLNKSASLESRNFSSSMRALMILPLSRDQEMEVCIE